MFSQSRLKSLLESFLANDQLLPLAQETRFLRRKRCIDPLTWLLVLLFSPTSSLSFSVMAARYGALTGTVVSKQAFRQKTLIAHLFMKEFTKRFLSKAVRLKASKSTIDGIGRVLACDSSIQRLDGTLADEFPSTGGSAGQAALKLYLTYDLTNNSVEHLEVTSSNVSDQNVIKRQVETLKKRDLILADMGFFSISFYSDVDRGGAYFISKLPIHVVEVFEISGERVDLWSRLFTGDASIVEMGLLLGRDAEKLLCRIVARRLSRKEHRKRVKELNANRKQRGDPPLSEAKKKRARWIVFVTNLPKTLATSKQIFGLYRLRWQVELVYKGMKTHAALKSLLRYRSLKILLTMIYARLLASLFALITHREVQKRDEDEIMYLKWCACLAGVALELLLSCQGGKAKETAEQLFELAHKLCRREKRKRKTSREHVTQCFRGRSNSKTPSPCDCRATGVHDALGSRAAG